jgi:hypothetical protein
MRGFNWVPNKPVALTLSSEPILGRVVIQTPFYHFGFFSMELEKTGGLEDAWTWCRPEDGAGHNAGPRRLVT